MISEFVVTSDNNLMETIKKHNNRISEWRVSVCSNHTELVLAAQALASVTGSSVLVIPSQRCVALVSMATASQVLLHASVSQQLLG